MGLASTCIRMRMGITMTVERRLLPYGRSCALEQEVANE